MASLPTAVSLRDVHLYYGAFRAVKDVTLDIPKNRITALIGPSGCGKSTLLRSINRMNDLIPCARVEGEILFHGENLYADYVDPVEVRRRIGMVFQKANPFPKSIYDNIAFGPRITGMQGQHGSARRVLPPPRRPVGRGARTSSASRASPSLAASSSVSASPGRSRRSRT